MPNESSVRIRLRVALSRFRQGKRGTHTYAISDGPKMLRETLCTAQSAVAHSPWNEGRKREHMDRLQRLIDECDRHRPLGSDGKHGNRHTPTCGCDDR